MWIIHLAFLFLPFNFTSDYYSIDHITSNDICLSNEEQSLYNQIMEYRTSKNLTSIPFSAKLSKVAQTHARDLAENYDFDPNNKCNPHSWSKKGEWSSCCYTNDHKQAQCMWDKPREIANYEGDGYEIAYYHSNGAKADPALAGWQKSKGHNPLLVNLGIWKEIEWKGIGIGIHETYAIVWFGRVNDSSKIVSCE